MPSGKSSLKSRVKSGLTKIYFIKNIFKQKNFVNFFSLSNSNNEFAKQKEFDQITVKKNIKKKWPSIKQLKYLPQVLNSEEKKKIKILSYIILICFIALVFNLFFTAPLVPRNGGNYTEGLVGLPKFINPLYTSLNQVDQDIGKLIFSGLVKIDNNLDIVPDLAENWFVSEDQKIYTFKLRKNVFWHDGEPLTIYDVLFTFEALQNSEYKSPMANNFADVIIEKIDEQTIQFKLKEPYAPFLENLTIGILPEHLWQEVVPANTLLADYNLKPVGSGPFQFKSFTKDKLGNIKLYKLVRNEKYYEHPPYLDEINFKFYADYKSATLGLKNRNIDGLNYLPKELQTDLTSRKDINYHSLQLPQYTALFFNSKNNSLLSNVSFKKALSYALDKQEIINQALNGNGSVINAPILPGFIGYHPNIAKYEYSLIEAEKILNNLGYTKKEGESFRSKDDKELTITLTAVNKGENFLTAQILQKMWQALGIKTEINFVDAGVIKTEIIKTRNFEILLFGEIVGIDPDPYPFWHSSQAGENGLNLANFVNREADKVLVEARQITDPEKRRDKYIHFQNILNNYLPAIFLYTPKYIYPMSDNIKGIEVTNISAPTDRFSNITNWFIKTKRDLF
ncbi:ABC transporter substrate-binding protein [Patescibacteria group bacterium]